MSNQAKAVIKTTDSCLQLQFGPNRLLHSAAVSEGSGLQDCSTHQTASDHSQEESSNPDSCRPKSKNNSCFMSPSKRNRPVSVPVGQPRSSKSSLKLKSPHNCQGLSQKYKLQPRVIRVTAYKNGSGKFFAKVTAPTIASLLETCTHKLNLNMAARRVFLADGTEALKPEDIPHDANIYVSTGEPFLDPFKKIKAKSRATTTTKKLVCFVCTSLAVFHCDMHCCSLSTKMLAHTPENFTPSLAGSASLTHQNLLLLGHGAEQVADVSCLLREEI
ncbi:hypothetical protein A6R68_05727, partial [Neotoma lepida]